MHDKHEELNRRMTLYKTFLSNNGYDSADLDALEIDELQNKYETLIKKQTNTIKSNFRRMGIFDMNTSAEISGDEYDLNKLKLELQEAEREVDIGKYYSILGNALDHISYDLISKSLEFILIKHSSYIKAQRILNIKFREMQEVLLYKIYNLLGHLAKEERARLINYYEKSRDNIPYLQSIIANLSEGDKIESLQDTINLKLDLMHTYHPEQIQEDYKAYYDSSPEKADLLEKIQEEVRNIDMRAIKQLSIDGLKDIYELICEQRRLEEEDRRLFASYKKQIADVTRMGLDENFIPICFKSIENIGVEKTRQIVTELSEKNPALLTQFNKSLSFGARRGIFD